MTPHAGVPVCNSVVAGNQPMRETRPTFVIGRSYLLVGMMFCLLVASVLVFVLISPGVPH